MFKYFYVNIFTFLKNHNYSVKKIIILFIAIFGSFRSRLALAAQGATFGVSKDIMSFQTWLPWQRALQMASRWGL